MVADQDAHRILLIDPDGPDGGSLLGQLGTGTPGAGPDLFDDPEGVAVDGNRYFFSVPTTTAWSATSSRSTDRCQRLNRAASSTWPDQRNWSTGCTQSSR